MAVCKGVGGDGVHPLVSPVVYAPVVQEQRDHQMRGPNLHQDCGPPESTEVDDEIEVDLREVYFLIMHFLSSGPCHRATGQLWNELLQHKLLPRRYHGLCSRNGVPSTDEDDDGLSFPLSYIQVTERFKNIEKNHLVKLLQQLLVHDRSASLLDPINPRSSTAADVPTLLGSGAFSLLESEQRQSVYQSCRGIEQLRWPHWQADQVHALGLRELGGGFSRHHRSPSVRTPKHVIAKPSVLVNRIKIIKVLRGHRNAVYCAIFDHSGQYLITGSDDRLVKIWSAESGLCLRSCRGHEGDITDLSVSYANTLVASASNDSSIRVWRLPDGLPVSVLRGHTAGVTAIEFSPRQGCEHHLLSSSEDGTCRIWDARDSSINSRVYMPKPDQDLPTAQPGAPAQSSSQGGNQILCCAFNADGSFFVTGSSDKLARVWDARKWADEFTGRPNYELDILSGHENVVNYVQFSGCAEPRRFFPVDILKEDNMPRFKNSWFAQDSIVTCSRDGSAIIWSPRPRKQVKLGRWVKAYHLKVPPPPMPQPCTRTGGPRQRLLPTPRGVNMIVWSLDNRFVLAAIMDCRICVWNAVDGSLVHCLTGHNKQTYVLDVHPYNPRIAMSAGYDGRVIIWDIWEGRPVRTYETGDFNLVDGNFSPDGTSLIVSDEVGQVYLFATGIGNSQKDAQYDQFFLGDFRPLVRDTCGNVLDQETQLPPHQRNLQDLLCDASMLPYPEPYQSTYQQRRLGALGIDWQPPLVQLAVGTLDDPAYVAPEIPQDLLPPVQTGHGGGNRWVEQPTDVDAMDWDEEVTGLSEDSGSDYCASEESLLSDDDGVGESESYYEDTTDTEAEEADYDSQSGVRSMRTRRSDRNKRKEKVDTPEDTPERQAKRMRYETLVSNNVSNEERPRSHRSLKGKRVKRTDSEEPSRPMRVAARNALSMFSSLNDEEEDEGGHIQLSAEDSERLAATGEIQRFVCSAISREAGEQEPPKNIADTSDVGECRRPRSRRKLVLKLRNSFQKPDNEIQTARVNCESSGFTDQDPSKEHDVDEVGDSKPNDVEHVVTEKIDDGHSSEDDINGSKWKGKRRYMWKKGKAVKRAHFSDHTSSSGEGSNENKPNGEGSNENKPNGEGSNENKPSQEISEVNGLKGNESLFFEHELPETSRQGHGSTKENVPEEAVASFPVTGLRLKLKAPFGQGPSASGNGCIQINGVENVPRLQVSEQEDHDQATSKHFTDESTDYFDEEIRDQNQVTISNESMQNEESADERQVDRDPDYCHEETPENGNGRHSQDSDNDNSDLFEHSSKHDESEEMDASDDVDDELAGHKRHKGVEKSYSRRNNAASTKNKKRARRSDLDVYEHPGLEGRHAKHSSSGRRKSTRLAQSARVETVSNRMSTRSKGKARKGGSSFEIDEKDEDSDYRTSMEEDDSDTPKARTRSSTRLRRQVGRKVDFRYKDFQAKRNHKVPHRNPNNVAWLLLTEVERGTRYIPQFGDHVVYVRQGHQDFLELRQLDEDGPWGTFKSELRAVEFCQIVGLDYLIFPDSGDTYCKLMLEFTEGNSKTRGGKFSLCLPELTDFPDFIVERSRYEASIARNWTNRDKCQVWWRSDEEEGGGRWWEGRVTKVKAKSPEFIDSPWETLTVEYKSDPQAGGTLHSPWELFDLNASTWESPHIDENTTGTLLSVIDEVQNSNQSKDEYGLWRLQQAVSKPDFLDRIPLPLSVDVIRTRLEKNYYRSFEALTHDLRILLSNFRTYFGRDHSSVLKVERLKERFCGILEI